LAGQKWPKRPWPKIAKRPNANTAQKGYRIIDTMIVDNDNGGILMNHAIRPKHEVGKNFSWSVQGMWLQPNVSCHSTNITRIAWKNGTDLLDDWLGKMVINNTDIHSSDIDPIGDRGQMTNLSSRSTRYSPLIQHLFMQELNMTTNGSFFESPIFGIDSFGVETVQIGAINIGPYDI